MNAQMTATAAGEGLAFHFDRQRGGNTFDAHRLVHLAAEHGLQDAMKERLMRAYFSEGELMSDHAALARLAAEVGLPADAVARAPGRRPLRRRGARGRAHGRRPRHHRRALLRRGPGVRRVGRAAARGARRPAPPRLGGAARRGRRHRRQLRRRRLLSGRLGCADAHPPSPRRRRRPAPRRHRHRRREHGATRSSPPKGVGQIKLGARRGHAPGRGPDRRPQAGLRARSPRPCAPRSSGAAQGHASTSARHSKVKAITIRGGAAARGVGVGDTLADITARSRSAR